MTEELYRAETKHSRLFLILILLGLSDAWLSCERFFPQLMEPAYVIVGGLGVVILLLTVVASALAGGLLVVWATRCKNNVIAGSCLALSNACYLFLLPLGGPPGYEAAVLILWPLCIVWLIVGVSGMIGYFIHKNRPMDSECR